MENSIDNGSAKAGTVGGTLLVVLLKVDLAEMTHTVFLAVIGAVSSYAVSALIKFIIRKCVRK